MGKLTDQKQLSTRQLFTIEQAAAAFEGKAEFDLVLKADIVRAEDAAMIYVIKGDYTEPWPNQDPANRGAVLVPHQLDKVLQMLHEAWREALLALEPGDRDLDPKSPEITALQGLALNYTDKRLHRDELSRWAALNGYESDEFGAIEPQTAPAPTQQHAKTVLHTTKGERRRTLRPEIEHAQSKCKDPCDSAEVWGALQIMAQSKYGQLIGATEDGLQYLESGDAKIFTRDALGKRLNRKAPHLKKPPISAANRR